MNRFLLPGIVLAFGSAAAFAQEPCFSSTGGPNGDFDWVVHSGDVFFFDTTFTTVVGGPGGVPTAMQDCVDGLIEVRNLVIEEGATVRVQGPNPMRVQASGEVIVRGLLDLSGFRANNVATLNTGHITERGGAGAAGGGMGGNANVLTDQSSPRGGPGDGPFGEVGTGAEGGESGYAPALLGKDARRPGGGGGARFAADRDEAYLDATASTIAGAGTDGSSMGSGAESGMPPAQGGEPNVGAFTDANARNDFFGVRPIVRRGRMIELVRGELPGLWAGYGGGGGGNAIPASSFPNPNWSFSTDEKGGGGGGGGGALHVQALGRIVFGAAGQVRSNGARGGTGENTNFLDHVGGTGGSGSGGHVVLESAEKIDFTDGGAVATALPREWVAATGQLLNRGPTSDVNVCCRNLSNGGPGGGGVLQLHVPNPVLLPSSDPDASNIVVPAPIALLREPLDAISSPEAYVLFPTCDPSPRTPFGWFGVAGLDARRSFVRAALDAADERDLASELVELEMPRRF